MKKKVKVTIEMEGHEPVSFLMEQFDITVHAPLADLNQLSVIVKPDELNDFYMKGKITNKEQYNLEQLMLRKK